MTFADLKLMCRQDINRADKEAYWYPIWINRALQKIQTDASFQCMRRRTDVVMTGGNLSAPLPSSFKELTPEVPAVTLVDPSVTSLLREVPCDVSSRETIVGTRAGFFSTATPAANVRGSLAGLPVYLEWASDVWTLNIVTPISQDITFRVSHFSFLPALAADSDHNYLTDNYPELVENQVKATAFAAINDPIGGDFAKIAEKQLSDAILEDQRRSRRGRVLRMGG